MLDPNRTLSHLTQSMGGHTVQLEVELAMTKTELDAAKSEITQLRQQLADATTTAAEQPVAATESGQAT